MNEPVKMICPKCGSGDISQYPSGAVCLQTKALVPANIYDCDTCDYHGSESDFSANRKPLRQEA